MINAMIVFSMIIKKIPLWLSKVSKNIIDHMNRDHKKSIISTLYAQHGVKDQNVKMFKLDVNGYYAVSENKYYFLVFEKNCQSLSQYKAELIKHAKKNKKYELAK